MQKSQFELFKSIKFAPLFWTQFLGAFNDNFYKSAMSILITYKLAGEAGLDASVLVTIAAGIFILPFVIFSAFAGQLADKYERSSLVQKIKIAEIIIMCGASVSFYLGSIFFLMLVLFLMGAQSAFFGPLKYSILPQMLEQDRLIGANGLIETGTFLAILLGTIFGGLLIMRDGGLLTVIILVIGIAFIGWLTSRYIPRTAVVDPSLKLRFNIFIETLRVINYVRPMKRVFPAVLGISWFYLVGATFLSQFPTYAKIIIGANEGVAMFFLAVFSVGTGIGSIGCNTLLKGKISGRYVSRAAFGISIAGLMLYFLNPGFGAAHEGEVMGMAQFLAMPRSWGIILSLLAISSFGGIYVVPLYAIIQTRSRADEIARVTACVNVMDSFFMVISSVLATSLLLFGFSIPQIFLVISLLTAAASYLLRGFSGED